MSENQKPDQLTIEVVSFNPEVWSQEEQDSLIEFIKIFLIQDKKNNPENYKIR